MSKLTFKEFMMLPRKVQNMRYKELSDHDKFLARMSDCGFDIGDRKPEILTKEQVSEIAKKHGIKEKGEE